MEGVMQQALEIVKAQASTRSMTSDEITSMIRALTSSINAIADGTDEKREEPLFTLEDAKKSIKEKSVSCLECGKSFKVLTRRHLATHDLTPEEYKEKWGFKKGTSLVSKSLARDRRKTMSEMKLWERRVKVDKPDGPKVPKNARNPAAAEIE